MKITDVKAYPVKDWRTFLFVFVETDAGVVGLGESGLSGHERATMGALEHLRPMVVGQDPFRTEHLWQTMWRGGFFPAGQVLASAVAAIDVALWDIKGKALGVPVYELLGGRVRDRAATYTHLRAASPEALLEAARAAVDEGWRCLRWEPFADADGRFAEREAVDRAIGEFAMLREALGEAVDLCFDAHTKLSLPEAVRFCRGVEPFRPLFVEDALRSENPASYRRLRDQVAVPLAAGEQYAGKWHFREAVEGELIDVARIDICIAGGLTEAKKIAALCEVHNIDIALHNPLGPVSTAACLHFNLACPNFLVHEQPRLPGSYLADLFPRQPQWRDGDLLPPTGPGLGLEVDLDKLPALSGDPTPLPMLHRPDGSFTNW